MRTHPSLNGFLVNSCSTVCLLFIQPFFSGFTQRYLSAPESDNDAAQDNGVAFDSATTSLLREWTKSKLSSGSWKDALVVAIRVSVSACHASWA